MSSAAIASLGVVVGALMTAIVSAIVTMLQHRDTARSDHRVRAFERHFPQYERIFVTARSAQDALRDYAEIEKRVTDRSDPFLRQLLEIFADMAYQYCVAVNWKHNPGMVYLDIKLERKCLFVRNLLLEWLSRQRITTGDMAFVRQNGIVSGISLDDARSLEIGTYQELRIERRRMVAPDAGDARRISRIDRALTAVIVDLKAVMSA